MLYFDKVQFLAYEQTPVVLGAGIRYKVKKKFTIRGILLSTTSQFGTAAILSKEEQLIAAANDNDDIYLNGIFFGQGKINSIKFDEGNAVRTNTYTYEIESYIAGNLSNASSGEYAGINWTDAPLWKNIEENFEYSNDTNGEQKFVHNVSVAYNDFTSPSQGISLAKAVASNFFSATTGLNGFLNSYSNLGGIKRLYTELYDAVSCKCSFSEIIIIPKLEEAGKRYSYSLEYNVKLGTDGFTEVEEKVKITGLTSPRFAGAKAGLSDLKGSAFGRAQTVYNSYNFSNATLFSQPIRIQETVDKFKGTIELSSLFSNNPRYQSTAIWEYTSEISRSEDGYYSVSERGKVIGLGRPGFDRYNNAFNFFEGTVLAGVSGRLASSYATTGRAQVLTLIEQSLDKNQYAGIITYTFTETDNNLFSSDPNFKKVEIQTTTKDPVHLTENYSILNVKEIIQPQNQTTLGERAIQINLRGKRGTDIGVYLSKCLTVAASLKPNWAPDVFLQDVKYSLRPVQNDFSFSATFVFVGNSVAFGNLTLSNP